MSLECSEITTPLFIYKSPNLYQLKPKPAVQIIGVCKMVVSVNSLGILL